MQLRDYQQQILTDIKTARSRGKNRIAVIAGTGAGKSVIIASLIKEAIGKGKRVAVMAHRAKLLKQLHGTIKHVCDYESSFIMAGKKTDENSLVQLCMAQTLASKKRKAPDVDMIILDECHVTSYSEGFNKLMDATFGKIWVLSNKTLIGLTATPYRLNKREGLCRHFDFVINAPSPRDLIAGGYLTPPEVYTFADVLNWKTLKVDDATDDYNSAAINKALTIDYVTEVITNWAKISKDEKTIVFAGNVSQCKLFKQEFAKMGITSEYIIGSTKKTERDRLFEAFDADKFQVLICVSVLTEGFDQPDIKTVVLARPSKSLALVCQMVGRGMRLHESKEHFNIIDCSGFFINYGHMEEYRDKNHETQVRDFFNLKPTDLCPTPKTRGEAILKNCTSSTCNKPMHAALTVCPHCGEAQPIKTKEPLPLNYPDLIKIDGIDIKAFTKHLKWTHKALEKAFVDGKSPGIIEEQFLAKFGEFMDANTWKGAVVPEDNDLCRGVVTYWLAVSTGRKHDSIVKYYTRLFGDSNLVKPFSPSTFLGLEGKKPQDLTQADVDNAYFDRGATISPGYENILTYAYREVSRRIK